MFTVNNSVHVHEQIDRKPMVCFGQRVRLMWGAKVEPLVVKKNGRVLVRWFDGIKYWYGWTYKENLAHTGRGKISPELPEAIPPCNQNRGPSQWPGARLGCNRKGGTAKAAH